MIMPSKEGIIIFGPATLPQMIAFCVCPDILFGDAQFIVQFAVQLFMILPGVHGLLFRESGAFLVTHENPVIKTRSSHPGGMPCL